jgi:hypothetical protein
LHFQLKKPENEMDSLMYLHIHDLPLAKLPDKAIMLDNWKLGSGQLLMSVAHTLTKGIKEYAKEWTRIWFSEMKKPQTPARQGLPWFSEATSIAAANVENIS